MKDIRRATRRQFSAEEKIRIVLEGLRGEDSIAELCRREGIAVDCTTAGRRSSWKPASGAWRATPRARRPARRGEGAAPRGGGAEGGRGRSDPREPAAQKKHDSGLGATANEISRSREARDHPAGRRVASAGSPDPGAARGPRSTFYRWYDRYQERGRRPGGSFAAAGPGLEPHPRPGASDRRPSRSRSRSCHRANWPCASPTRSTLSQRLRSIACSRRMT